MSTINIKCVDQVLSFTNTPIITAGDQNVDKVAFDFCPIWDGFVKVAVFFKQKEECSYAMINADGVCNIPNSIMKLDGKIYIAVTGVNTKNQILTSNIVAYYVDEGIVDASLQDEFPNEGTPEEQESIYNKILDMCTDMQDLCQDLIKNLAYVRVKNANEFEYDESKLEAKIRAYTYNRDTLDTTLSDMREDFERATSAVRSDLEQANTSNASNFERLEGFIDYTESFMQSINDDIKQERNKRIEEIDKLSEMVIQLNNRLTRLEG